MTITFFDFLQGLINSPGLIVITILISAVMYTNGSSDIPNSIATCISTRSLDAKKTLIIAIIFNFLGVFLMTFISSKVAETILNIANFGDETSISIIALISALIGITLWSIITWYFGIPSSKSHALIAGISGAAIAIHGDLSGINFKEWGKVIFGLIVVNLSAFLLGYITTKLIENICKDMDRRKTNRFFRKTQIIGAAAMSFMNGAQDGQKFMAIILLGVAFSKNVASTNFVIPIWLIIHCSIFIALGAIIGGLRVIKTIGTKVVKVEKYQGTAADISSAICLFVSTTMGIPVSSTHTKNSAIMGVGASKRLSNVNWKTARNMVLTWICTFPGCGILGFVLTKILINII